MSLVLSQRSPIEETLAFFLRNGIRLIINLECFNEQINAFVQATAHFKTPPLTKREILVLLLI